MGNELKVIAPNLNRRLSGVTSTIVRLVPLQAKTIDIASFGLGLPDHTPRMSFNALLTLNTSAVWHARRNMEMLLGLFLKYILRKKLKLLFTSASQREHSAYTKFLIRQMDKVVATSNAGKAYLKVPASVIYHGINTTEFQPPSSTFDARNVLNLPELKLIGCFGRIRAQKGTDLFVDTMLDVLPKHSDWGAVILGRATEQHTGFLAELKAKVAAAGLEDRILFSGEVPVDQIAQWYQALDLLVAPQRWEGFGLTPLEAMACGTPVIATRVGAFPELIIENETGHLIDRDNLSQMIEATEKLISHSKQRAKFGVQSRSHMVENFDISVEANKLIEIYRELAS
ncbi:MAG: glycosyltransferase family 4 protein [Rhizobiaceae bacterium]